MEDGEGGSVPDSEATAVRDVWGALGGSPDALGLLRVEGRADALPAGYAVGGLAVAAVAALNLAAAELLATRQAGPGADRAVVAVDRVHAAAAFRAEALLEPSWTPRPAWDRLAGDYPGADGWIRLHTNYAHHRRAALDALGLPAETDREEVAGAVARRPVDELEATVVAAGGCAAALRSPAAWAAHPQGRAVAAEPLVGVETGAGHDRPRWAAAEPTAPLAGVRVLDLTRVIAGPVATGVLAALGADVLRVDPVAFDEVPALVPMTTAGKRCCRLDLAAPAGRDTFAALVAGADLLVTGLRPGALDGLGFTAGRLRELSPGLVAVRLDAYGWTGPWATRRGFDSLVQMSSGIAAPEPGSDGRPSPLPAQALDHATGYLAAAAAARGLVRRLAGEVTTSRLSLARTAALLTGLAGGRRPAAGTPLSPEEIDARRERVPTAWGPARRIRWPVAVAVAGVAPVPGPPAGPLGAAPAAWPAR